MENKIILSHLVKKFDFSSDSFNKRMISQKALYTLQKMGLGTTYSFNWYLYGVYSQELADDFFQGIPSPKENLTEEQGEIIKKFEELCKENLENPSFLELVSSIIYLIKEEPFADKEIIFGKLVKFKPHLNDKDTFDSVHSKVIHLLN